jgi:CRISPR-associated endonuclease/helicase Cas3
MLKGMYRLKGYEAQLTDYHNGLFIFDEIHAYEVRRLALILRTVAYLRRNYNARFLVMSATFPSLIRGWLAEALGETPVVAATPGLYAEYQRHRIRLVAGDALDEANLARVRDVALTEGKSVLLVCNVVARAQEAHDWLSKQLAPAGIETVLLHGRFNMRDRQKKVQIIRERTGAGEERRGPPIVLVATQAVEVSLDIDLDTLYSDPAPLEALVQRFGRVNRRGKKGIVDVHVFTTPPDAQKKIYDERLVARTLGVLERENGRAMDESAVGRWLDEIYDGEIAEEWRKLYASTAAEFDAAVVDTMRPFQSDRDIEERFDKLFDGMEVLPASDLDQYEALLKAGQTINAGELLVPLSYRQYAQINKARLAWPLDEKRRWPMVVEVPYTPEQGLDLSALARQRKEEEEPGI